MDLLDDDAPAAPRSNAPEYSVSDLSNAIKRMVEGEFPFVRVRGEVGRVARPASGHLYFDLKDDRAVLAAIAWKGQAARLTVKPEEGMEVVATGRLTTFPGQSKYQMTVEDLAPAGAGALMAQLEARRRALAAEGLFDAGRKRPLPALPSVIGVVTSPSGAVIRDILHRLADRFPRRVLVWPVAVQGAACAPEVARAIAGFNALPVGGPIPRPDVLIVARGGGSIEDLWGFNDEAVVRAAAASAIPLVSAVGHETDWTLIDHAADVRAPTPTAAAEMVVPVRADLLARVGELGLRLDRAAREGLARRRDRLERRALPRAESLTAPVAQRLDLAGTALPRALVRGVEARRLRLARAPLSAGLLRAAIDGARRRVARDGAALAPAFGRRVERQAERLDALADRLGRALRRPEAAPRIDALGERLDRGAASALRQARQRASAGAERLSRLRPRLVPPAEARFARSILRPPAALDVAQAAVAAQARLLDTLSYRATLARGYAVVRADGAVATSAQMAQHARRLDIEFADGHVAAAPLGGEAPRPRRTRDPGGDPGQGSLL